MSSPADGKSHPLLVPPFVEFVAVHVAPPVATLYEITQEVTVIVPELQDSVCVAEVADVIVAPVISTALAFVNVVVVPAVNFVFARPEFILNASKELLPVMVRFPVLPVAFSHP